MLIAILALSGPSKILIQTQAEKENKALIQCSDFTSTHRPYIHDMCRDDEFIY